MAEPIRVQLCDDHALVRTGLRRLLDGERDLRVVAESATAGEAVADAARWRPDVLVLDLVLPDRHGLDVLPDLARVAPDTHVLVLSMQDEPPYVRRAFSSGAHGYLVKEAAASDLVEAVRTVAGGRRYLHPSLGADFARLDGELRGARPLSGRERDVLRLLALGHTNQEIAKLLFVSVRTAESHRAHIMQKLGLHSRADLVRYALATGELLPSTSVRTG